ncbi:hypothetical protein PHJA_002422500 [Phtheirospermum japonicum]|uniref:Uncharacterized protein n=1 Tax=Phtheirospermum japonicum TaxID=374723 RepID=A0A830D6P2_9LAMI|nr:hypothetical protein PHJA_002422500 [Phtheirospermum japonicum]
MLELHGWCVREEISYLMEILDSRVDNEWEKRKSSNDAGVDTQLISGMHEIQRPPSNEKQLDLDYTTIGTSRVKLNVPTGVSASPIDIARAYMAVRTSEGSHDLYNITSNGERAESGNEFSKKPLLPSPSPKPSVCWPGALVHDRLGYITPQAQRSIHRLQDFPRTLHSRAMLSKSKTKLQAESGYANTSTPFQQSHKSVYGQIKSRGDIFDVYGSAGSFRRVRNKFSPEVRPRGSIFGPPKDKPLKMVKPAFGGFLPSTEKTLELGETSGASTYWSGDNVSGSSDRGIPNPNLSSTEAVKKILEHLDRNKPTPKEKEDELKLATAWRKSSPVATDATHDKKISSMHVEELTAHENADIVCVNFPVGVNKSSSESSSLVVFQDKGMEEATDLVSGNAKASSSIFTGPGIVPGANVMPCFGLKETPGSVVKSLNENAVATTNHRQPEKGSIFSRPHLGNGQDVKMVAGTTGSEFSRNNGNKPSLPSISINKSQFRAVSSENGPGFTFPVSASSGVLSEPPTPSITPSSSASVVSQPIGVPSVPSYTFGTKMSTLSLVFSFPSLSSTSTQDGSDLKFSFGSDKKARLPFSSIGKNAICY